MSNDEKKLKVTEAIERLFKVNEDIEINYPEFWEAWGEHLRRMTIPGPSELSEARKELLAKIQKEQEEKGSKMKTLLTEIQFVKAKNKLMESGYTFVNLEMPRKNTLYVITDTSNFIINIDDDGNITCDSSSRHLKDHETEAILNRDLSKIIFDSIYSEIVGLHR